MQMTRMEKSLESTTSAFATVRTGRANAAMLDRIVVSTVLSHTLYIGIASSHINACLGWDVSSISVLHLNVSPYLLHTLFSTKQSSAIAFLRQNSTLP